MDEKGSFYKDLGHGLGSRVWGCEGAWACISVVVVGVLCDMCVGGENGQLLE